jgi:hypothetical protein
MKPLVITAAVASFLAAPAHACTTWAACHPEFQGYQNLYNQSTQGNTLQPVVPSKPMSAFVPQQSSGTANGQPFTVTINPPVGGWRSQPLPAGLTTPESGGQETEMQ